MSIMLTSPEHNELLTKFKQAFVEVCGKWQACGGGIIFLLLITSVNEKISDNLQT